MCGKLAKTRAINSSEPPDHTRRIVTEVTSPSGRRYSAHSIDPLEDAERLVSLIGLYPLAFPGQESRQDRNAPSFDRVGLRTSLRVGQKWGFRNA